LGYDLHITRKDDWSDTDGPAITREEWLDYVGSDKSMRPEREAVVVANERGEEFSVQDETLATWKDWPNRKDGKSAALLWYSAGNIVATNLIADALGGKLQGDDGEIYNSIGMVDRQDRSKKPWWKFW
jgi:hypothetical protein